MRYGKTETFQKTKFSGKTEICMTEGAIGKQLLFYTLPILLSQIFQQFYSVADAAVIGQYAGADALAAVGTTSLLLSVIVNFFIGLSTGISVVISRLFGAEEYEKLKDAIIAAILACLAAGFLMTITGITGVDSFLKWLGTPKEVYTLAKSYLAICFFGMIPQLIYNMGTAILRSLGNTKSPLIYLIVSSIVNLILDVSFIAFFHMGIKGAAWATLLSQYLSAILILIKLFSLDEQYRMSLSIPAGKNHKEIYKELLTIGFPAGMQAIFMSISSLVIQTSINSFGASAMAGMTVYAKIEGFLYYPLFSFGMAVTGFVGQNYGAQKKDRIQKGMKLALLIAVLFSVTMAIILIICSEPVLRFFTNDQAVIQNGQQAIYSVLPFYFLYGINQVYIGGIRGLNDTAYPMITSLISYCIFRVVFCRLILPIWHDMRVIYWAYDLSWIIMIALLIWRYITIYTQTPNLETAPK